MRVRPTIRPVLFSDTSSFQMLLAAQVDELAQLARRGRRRQVLRVGAAVRADELRVDPVAVEAAVRVR